MALIAFLGCDGSGKSAVIDELKKRLNSEGFTVDGGHWRPEAFSSKRSGAALASADDPHGQESRGLILSVLKLIWLWLNWWVAWWRVLRVRSRQGYVLFDVPWRLIGRSETIPLWRSRPLG